MQRILSHNPFHTTMASNETYFVLWGLRPFWLSDIKQSNEYSIKQR